MRDAGLAKGWERQLVQALIQPDVERIILFGSRARGKADEYSDLDLVVVRRTPDRFLKRLEDAYQRLANARLKLGVDVDILVYTPEEYQRMLDSGNPLVTLVHREGRVLYERPAR